MTDKPPGDRGDRRRRERWSRAGGRRFFSAARWAWASSTRSRCPSRAERRCARRAPARRPCRGDSMAARRSAHPAAARHPPWTGGG